MGGGGGRWVRSNPPLAGTSSACHQNSITSIYMQTIARKHEIALGNRGTSILNGAPTARPQQTAAAEPGEGP